MVIHSKRHTRKSLHSMGIKNLVPGTLSYRGTSREEFAIDIQYYDADNLIKKSFKDVSGLTDYENSIENKKSKVKWINVTGLNNTGELDSLGNYIGIPSLILEQVVNINNHSSSLTTTDFIYSNMQMIYLNKNKTINETISIFMNKNYLITFQEKPGDVFNSIRNRLETGMGLIRTQTLGYLYFCLIDAIVDNYLDVLNSMEYDIQLIEEKIVNLEKVRISDIHEIRKILMLIKFSSMPMEKFVMEMINKRPTLLEVPVDYLDSLHVNLKEASNNQALLKETVDNLFENYVLNNSNNMNQIMTILTIFSAIFIPLSFLAGVFGMNFEYLPGLSNKLGFFYFLIGCVFTGGGMLLFFKFKKWF